MKRPRGMDGGKDWIGGLYSAVLALTLLHRPPCCSDTNGNAPVARVEPSSPWGATEPAAVADLRFEQEFLRRNPGIELVAAEGIRIEGTVSEVTTVMMKEGLAFIGSEVGDEKLS